jgi:hypothetical protein
MGNGEDKFKANGAKGFNVKVEFTDGEGFLEVSIGGKTVRFPVRKSKGDFYVKGIPFKPRLFKQLLKREFKDVENDILNDIAVEAELALEEAAAKAEYKKPLATLNFLNYKIEVSEDSVKIYSDGAVERFSLSDSKNLELKLLELARRQGLKDEQAVGEIEKLLSKIDLAVPKLVLEDEKWVRRIITSNGLTRPMYGGIVETEKGVAVYETTLALMEKVPRTGSGAPIRTIEPITFLAVYDGEGNLVERKCFSPIDEDTITIWDTPVLISKGAVPKWLLKTLMDYRTGLRFLNGEVSKTFREIAEQYVEKLKRYIAFWWDERLYSLCAAWAISTYFKEVYSAFPRIPIAGAFGTGKTRLTLSMVNAAYHGYVVTDPSEAAIFRMVEALGVTLGIDEKFINAVEAIVDVGYKRGVEVPRVEKTSAEEFTIKGFNVYHAAVYNSQNLPKERALQRSIPIIMQRLDQTALESMDPERRREIVEMLKNLVDRDPEPEDLKEIREEMYLARLTRLHEVLKARKEVEKYLADFMWRDREIWEPIIVVAYLMGEEHLQNVLSLARAEREKRKEELYAVEKMVLTTIAKLFTIERANLENSEKLYFKELAFTASDVYKELSRELEKEGFSKTAIERSYHVSRLGQIISRIGFEQKCVRFEGGPKKAYLTDINGFTIKCKSYGAKQALLLLGAKAWEKLTENEDIKKILTPLIQNLLTTLTTLTTWKKSIGGDLYTWIYKGGGMEKIHVVTVVSVVSKIEEELGKKCAICPLRGNVCPAPKPSLECLIKFNVVDETNRDILELLEKIKEDKEACTKVEEKPPEESPHGKKEEVAPQEEVQTCPIICEENLQALLKATHGIQGYWSVEDISGAYHEAGGRNLYSLIEVLSSEEWIRNGRKPWIEKHPSVKGWFRLRR